MTTARKREAVTRLKGQHPAASQRRRCRVVGIGRSSVRYKARTVNRDDALTKELCRLARQHPRFGYRRMAALLRNSGWRVNDKRIARVWRQAGLKVPRKQVRKRRLGHSDNGCVRHRAERPNHVWSYDFVSDQTVDGRSLRMLAVVDEYTRESLAIHCAKSIRATDVIDVLVRLFAQHGMPEHIRSDNGPEFIAKVLQKLLKTLGIGPLYIKPGSPWENGYGESFNGKFRDELLDRELFSNLKEAAVIIERWRVQYNTVRPHSSLGYQTPAVYAQKVREGQLNA